VKEGYERRRFTKEGGLSFYLFLGERVLLDFLEGSLGGLLVESLSSVVGKDQYRGHRFAGGFGHGGQDIHMVSWS
jgi:hypothetical protein